MSIGMNRKTVGSLVIVLSCATGIGVAQTKPSQTRPPQTKPAETKAAQTPPAKGLHFEPQLTEVDAPGRMEAWDAKTRTLHVVPNGDVKVCLPHTTKAAGVHEHCLGAEAWGRLAHGAK
jgi:hypothetical protein